MARPVKQRRICELPKINEFAPSSRSCKGVVELTVDEYEVIRLIDGLGFTQEESAVQMQVARTTVQSIYDSARKKIADFLINGKHLKIGGGAYDLCPHAKGCCRACGKGECRGNGCREDGCQDSCGREDC